MLMFSISALAVSLVGCVFSIRDPFSTKGRILMRTGQCMGVISLLILFSTCSQF